MNKLVEELEQNVLGKKKVNPIFADNPYISLIQKKEPALNKEYKSLRRTKSRTRYSNFITSDN